MGVHPPAGLCAAGRGPGACTQNESGDAGGLRRQREATAGGEVQRRWLAPEFHHHRAERGAAQGIRTRTQDAESIARPHEDHPRDRQSEFGQARRMQPATFGIEKVLADPQKRPVSPDLMRQTERKPHRRAVIGAGAGEYLMHRAAHQAAAQNFIDNDDSQRGMIIRPA